uniref:Uncharacterized protein n=1 Tax=Romanomermis culicivorax TaxID=13658 RepID=A0A915HKI6_ROMCU
MDAGLTMKSAQNRQRYHRFECNVIGKLKIYLNISTIILQKKEIHRKNARRPKTKKIEIDDQGGN